MNEELQQDRKHRVLVVDRHVLVGQAISALFRASGEVAAMATVAKHAAGFAENFMPHVAMVDVSATITLPGAGTSAHEAEIPLYEAEMPLHGAGEPTAGKPPSVEESPVGELVARGRPTVRADAFATAAEILRRSPKTRLLFVDEDVHPLRVCRSLHAGGAGYWTKHAPFDQLFEAVCRIAREQFCFCPDVREHLTFVDQRWHLKPCCRLAVAKLTRRELEVMSLLVEGLSVRQCAEQMDISPNTADNHKANLMRKLCVHKLSELVRLALSQGLVEDE